VLISQGVYTLLGGVNKSLCVLRACFRQSVTQNELNALQIAIFHRC